MRTADPRPSAAGRRESLNLNPLAKGIRQYHTHRPLTGTRPQPALKDRQKLDAIVVPASRTAANLDQALTLARDAGCWLVILCSGQLDALAAREYADARSRSYGKVVAADIPAGYSHELLHFQRLRGIRSGLPDACSYYTTDLSIKRNIGLILARMLNWHRIFFLDDDIRDITYANLQDTVDMLGSYSAAGLWITDFPDNSIACHANRVTGESQDVFVSGAALAVSCDTELGFFPEIYNEDWLFFFDYASRGKLGNSQLKATQLEYSPFANPERAAWQEFGDLIAEGLYSLVHVRRPIEEATREYWGHFLEARRTFLEDVITRAEAAGQDMPEGLTLSVKEAVKTLLTIQPEQCERYVRAWRADMADWSMRLDGIRQMPSVDAALRELHLTPVTSTNPGKNAPPRREALPSGIAGPVTIPLSGAMRAMSERARMAAAISATDAGHPAAVNSTQTRQRRWPFGFGRQLPVAPSADAGEPALALAGLRFPEHPVSHSVQAPVLPTGIRVARVHGRVEVKAVLDLDVGVRLSAPPQELALCRRPEAHVLVHLYGSGVGGKYPEQELPYLLILSIFRPKQVIDQSFTQSIAAQLGRYPDRLYVPGERLVFLVLIRVWKPARDHAHDFVTALRDRPGGRPDLVDPVVERLRLDVLRRLHEGVGRGADCVQQGGPQDYRILTEHGTRHCLSPLDNITMLLPTFRPSVVNPIDGGRGVAV
jgi:hypothetical protein